MLSLMETVVRREDLVSVALGKKAADLVIKNGKLIDVFSGEIRPADVAIKGERIALVGNADHTIGENTTVIDAKGFFLSPGLMDTHIHIEASMVTPTQFARAVLPKGNTAVMWETLWTANVLGVRGIKLLLEECNKTPLKFFATATQGVPCAPTHLITSGHEFSIDDIEEILEWEQIVGLGEVVWFNEVLKNDHRVHEQIQLAIKKGKTVDGSSPGFMGKNLNAYVAAGVQSDHEAITLEEAIDRIRLGMRLVIREGASMRNLNNLIRVITEKKLETRRCCFCVDDKDIREIEKEGLIDDLVRKAIKAGVNPVVAVQMGSLNSAEYFGVDRDIGGIAPGRIADILLIDNLEEFLVRKVIVNGKVIAEDGKLVIDMPPTTYPEWAVKTVRVKRAITPDDFVYKTDRKNETKVRVIKVTGEQIISVEEIETLVVEAGEILQNPTKDILKLVVIERHGKTEPNIAKGFVRGFGFTQGAIATSIAPDVHQIIVVGASEDDISQAVNRLIELQGGIVICKNGEILADLSLPLAGLMSPEPYKKVIADLDKINKAAKEIGCDLPSPLMTLAFAGCPTLIEFKLSDKGLIDIVNGKLVPLEIE